MLGISAQTVPVHHVTSRTLGCFRPAQSRCYDHTKNHPQTTHRTAPNQSEDLFFRSVVSVSCGSYLPSLCVGLGCTCFAGSRGSCFLVWKILPPVAKTLPPDKPDRLRPQFLASGESGNERHLRGNSLFRHGSGFPVRWWHVKHVHGWKCSVAYMSRCGCGQERHESQSEHSKRCEHRS